MKNNVVRYDPNWADTFQIERKLLEHVLAPAKPVVEHVGSTAVPNLSALPIIDIMIGIPTLDLVDEVTTVIEGLGYRYRPEYEESIPERKFFSKSSQGMRTHHIHLVKLNEHFWDQYMFFRNHLRTNEKSRKIYNNLKIKLSNEESKDSHNYAVAKASFIKAIEEKFFY